MTGATNTGAVVRQDAGGRSARVLFAVYLFVLVLVIFPLTPKPTHEIKILLTHWAAFLLPGWVLLAGWVRREPFRRPRVFLPLMAAFLGWMVVSWALAPLRGHSLVTLAEWFALFMLWLAASQVYRTPGQVRALAAVVCVAVALSSAYGFVQKMGADPMPWDPAHMVMDVYEQMPATFGNPNVAAHVLILAVLFAMYVALGGGLWAAVLPLVGVYLAHQWYTTQRGGVLALGAALVVVLAGALFNRVTRRPTRAAVFTMVAVLAVGMLSIIALMGVLWVRTGTVYPLDMSLLLRYNAYQGGSEMIMARPLTGYGPGNYQIVNTPFWTPYEQRWFAQKQMLNDHVHNEVIESGVDGGLPLAFVHLSLLLAGVYFGLVMASRAQDRDTRRLGYLYAAFFTAFAIDGLFGFNLRSPVSGALFFVTAGTLDGVWCSDTSPPHPSRRAVGGLAWRVLLCAVALLAALLATRVFWSRMLLLRGMGAAQWGVYAESERLLARGEMLAPWDWRFAYELGNVAADQGQFEEAAGHYLRSLESKPYDLSALMSLAFARFNLAAPVLTSGTAEPAELQAAAESLALARRYAGAALELCPVLPQPHDTLGRAAFLHFSRLREIGAPESEIRSALDTMESHIDQALRYGAVNQGELLRFLSVARLGLGDIKGAGRALKRAGQSNPDDPVTWRLFYQYAENNGAFPEMQATLDGQVSRLVRETDANPNALAECAVWLGRVLVASEAFHAEVETAYKTAVQARPDRMDAWAEWAVYAGERGHVNGLIEVRDRLGEANELPALAAAFTEAVRDPAAALAATDSLVTAAESAASDSEEALPPDWLASPARYLLGRVADSGEAPARYAAALGSVLELAGDWEHAAGAFRMALDGNPAPGERRHILRQLAAALHRSGNMEEALALLRDPATGTPGDPVLLEIRADTLVAVGRTSEARLDYLQAMKRFAGDGDSMERVRRKLDQLTAGGGADSSAPAQDGTGSTQP
jgi:O-antigen ligase/tetratricopeptide (TPR) repeat protein